MSELTYNILNPRRPTQQFLDWIASSSERALLSLSVSDRHTTSSCNAPFRA
jgi:hypothetical protein